ncbi:MAG: hypothetical protein AB8H79_23470 [Myxococcota bacterium]
MRTLLSLMLITTLSACSDTADDGPTDTDTDSDTDTDTDTDSDTDTDTDTDVPQLDRCAALPAPSGNVVNVSPSDDLERILEGLESGDTAWLAAGTYRLTSESYIRLRTDNVSIRGATGDAEDVVIDGNWEAGFGLSINASDVTVSDLTIQRVYYHPVHVTPSDGRSIEGVRLYRVRIVDGAEQAIKINTGGEGTRFADKGEIACSHIELTDAGRAQVRNNCYTGGVDAHQAWGWHIRDNYIEGFWCDSGLSEHGVHMWRGGRDTRVERNVIVNSARGIGFGLTSDDRGRRYDDSPCGGQIAQSYNEVAQNNSIFADDPRLFSSSAGFDGGISLASACEATVVHNTVFSTQAPFASMEFRWPLTSGVIANNVVSHNIMDRGAGAMIIESNRTDAPGSWFVDAAGGDLHLAAGAPAIDAGNPTYGVAEDMDGDVRDGSPDAGMDER